MNKILIIGTGVIILIGLSAFAFWLMRTTSNQTSVNNGQNTGLSNTNSTWQNTLAIPTASSSATMTITANDGTTITTNNFIHNNITLSDPSNAGNYYLSGSSTNGYAIGYRMPAQFFTIALEQEPLGETRIAAENFLLRTLGISKNQLCKLNYYIGTDVHTNSIYAGKNLGFSFCPGATVLPQ